RSPPKDNKQPFPLREIWEKWHEGRDEELRDHDGLELLRAQVWASLDEWDWSRWQGWAERSVKHQEIVRILSGGHEFVKLRYSRVVEAILQWLVYLYSPKDMFDVLLDTVETAFAVVPAELNELLVELATAPPVDHYDTSAEPDWRVQEPFKMWVD